MIDALFPLFGELQLIKERNSEMDNILKELEKLRREHYTNDEDCWYSCPASGKNCNEQREPECDCGADKHNQILDNIINLIKR